MKRVLADFNSLDSAPVDLVKLAAPGSWQEAQLPPLQHGERVILYDFDGVEVEATVIHDEQGTSRAGGWRRLMSRPGATRSHQRRRSPQRLWWTKWTAHDKSSTPHGLLTSARPPRQYGSASASVGREDARIGRNAWGRPSSTETQRMGPSERRPVVRCERTADHLHERNQAMCGRFELVGGQRIFTRFRVANPDPTLLAMPGVDPQDVRPTQRVLLLTTDRVLTTAKWGLVPRWAKDARGAAKLINARVEGIADKPSFRKPLRFQRAIIPASAYFEWQLQPDGKRKVKYRVAPADGDLFGFAGLYETWQDRNDRDAAPLTTCTIITSAAPGGLAWLHDRTPLTLLPEDEERWLDPDLTDPDEIVDLLKPSPPDQLDVRAA